MKGHRAWLHNYNNQGTNCSLTQVSPFQSYLLTVTLKRRDLRCNGHDLRLQNALSQNEKLL